MCSSEKFPGTIIIGTLKLVFSLLTKDVIIGPGSLLFSSLFGQVIDWSEKPDPITAIQIFCDTDGIPIYVDGIQVGASPIKETIQVAPGWHQVSYFPPNMSIDTGSMNHNRKMRD